TAVVVGIEVSAVVVVVENGELMLPLGRGSYVEFNAAGEISLTGTLVGIGRKQLLPIEIPDPRDTGPPLRIAASEPQACVLRERVANVHAEERIEILGVDAVSFGGEVISE